MMSSKQLLYNNLYSMTNSDDVYKTGHVFSEVFTTDAYSVSPSMPLLVLFWLFLFGTLFRNFFVKCISALFPVLKVGDLKIDEDLDNYFYCVDDNDRDWSIKEEENARNVLNMKILEDETLEKLKINQRRSKEQSREYTAMISLQTHFT